MEDKSLSLIELEALSKQYCMSFDEILTAKSLFDHYYALQGNTVKEGGGLTNKKDSETMKGSNITKEDALPLPKDAENPVDSTTNTTDIVESVETEDNTDKVIVRVDDPERDARQEREDCYQAIQAIPRLEVKGLEQFFRDLQIPMSTLDIADLLDELSGPVPLLARERVVLQEGGTDAVPTNDVLPQSESKRSKSHSRPSSARDGKKKETSSNRPPDAAPNQARESYDGPVGVTFPMFLSLLQTTFDEEGPEKQDDDLAEAFKCMDVDGNGDLSVQDVRLAIEKFTLDNVQKGGSAVTSIFESQDHSLARLANMHDAEIKMALAECDVDGDGRISLEDLKAVMLNS